MKVFLIFELKEKAEGTEIKRLWIFLKHKKWKAGTSKILKFLKIYNEKASTSNFLNYFSKCKMGKQAP